MILPSLVISILAAASVLASPAKRMISEVPVIKEDFPDPGLMRDSSGTWYAYSTSSSSGLAPMSKSANFTTTWSTPTSVLSSIPWSDGAVWAPDVREISAGNYVMYFASHRRGGSGNDHCVGIATASSPEGPFTANSTPHFCNAAQGGVLGPSGFQAPDGARYLLWKLDGTSIGQKSRIMIQQVGANGYDLLGSPVELLTDGPDDGGVIEAASMVYWEEVYFVFFSSNDWDSTLYEISYAVSRNVTGPFTKATAPYAPFLKSGTGYGIAGPGGATLINVSDQYVNMVFHSHINGKDASNGRDMWTISNVCLSGGVAKICM